MSGDDRLDAQAAPAPALEAPAPRLAPAPAEKPVAEAAAPAAEPASEAPAQGDGKPAARPRRRRAGKEAADRAPAQGAPAEPAPEPASGAAGPESAPEPKVGAAEPAAEPAPEPKVGHAPASEASEPKAAAESDPAPTAQVAPSEAASDGSARAPRRRSRRQRAEEARAEDVADAPSPEPQPAPSEAAASGEAAGQPAAEPAAAPRPARSGRAGKFGKPVEEMSIEELVAQFSRRRRGRPSKKELQVREALEAAQANPTSELVDKARAAVLASLGQAQRAAAKADAAPEGQPADQRPAQTEPADGASQQPAEGAAEGGYGPRRRRHERRSDDRQERAATDRSQQQGQGAGGEGASWQKDRQAPRDRSQRRDRDGRAGQDRAASQQQGGYAQQRQRDGRDQRPGNDRQDRQQYGNGKNGRRNNRDRREYPAEPKANRAELEELKVGDLRAKANELGIDPTGLKKPELIDAVYAGLVRQEGFFEFKGILDLTNEGFGFIRTKGYLASENDVYISAGLVRSYALRRGDEVAGIAHAGRPNDKYPGANKVLAVNGKDPEELRGRPRFGDLTPVFPSEPLKMEHGRDSILGRCIDLVAPIGKGQRGLIVSPPKAGKTTVLKKIAESIAANNPEVHLICLLVDERPEEVTDMERSIKGEVVASTFDMPCDNHITVSELVVERAKRLVEQGEDVVILLDSITRLARAYNLAQPASGRILSGGVDSTALYPPKRFLGAARNIENGGSLTILASALVDTGSKMDEVIFEEFKGTGNMELRLDRDLADRRIFPAIDPIASGTRREELLLDPSIAPFVWGIRRILAGMNSNERAMSSLIKSLKATANNEEFLVRSAKKAQMQELNGDF